MSYLLSRSLFLSSMGCDDKYLGVFLMDLRLTEEMAISQCSQNIDKMQKIENCLMLSFNDYSFYIIINININVLCLYFAVVMWFFTSKTYLINHETELHHLNPFYQPSKYNIHVWWYTALKCFHLCRKLSFTN